MRKWVAIYPDKAACIILGAVVQKIVKPMGQVFTLQDVEAVSQIVFCGQNGIPAACSHDILVIILNIH